MMWSQVPLVLPPFRRGCHLITQHVVEAVPGLVQVEVGMLYLFLQHTSASLTINENADPDVRADMERALSHLCPEELPFEHTCEGPDDMPAHVKSSLFGCSLWVPIRGGRLALGTWQGIYLCEHRNQGGRRSVLLTWTA